MRKSYLYWIQQVQRWIPNLHLSPVKQLTSLRDSADSRMRGLWCCRIWTSLAMRAVSHHGSDRGVREVCVISLAQVITKSWFAHAWLCCSCGFVVCLSVLCFSYPHNHSRSKRETC